MSINWEEVTDCPECGCEISRNYTIRENMQFGTKIECTCGHIWIVHSSILRDKVEVVAGSYQTLLEEFA